MSRRRTEVFTALGAATVALAVQNTSSTTDPLGCLIVSVPADFTVSGAGVAPAERHAPAERKRNGQ